MVKITYWLLPGVWMGVIFYFSSQPSPTTSNTIANAGHFSEYALLALLLYIALKRTTKLNGRLLLVVAVLLAGAYGVTDELHQLFVPTRVSDINDVVVDFIGAGLMMLLISPWAGRPSKDYKAGGKEAA